jgi:hypothetical protein
MIPTLTKSSTGHIVREDSTPTRDIRSKVDYANSYHICNIVGSPIDRVELAPDKNFLKLLMHNGGYHRGWCFAHRQNCCEDVYIADISGHEDFHGVITMAEERVVSHKDLGYQRATFYHFETDNGGVMDVRWYGDSNGYYSVDVALFRIVRED